MRGLLEFFAPIPDAELPHLASHKTRGVGALAFCAVFITPTGVVNVVADLLRGVADPARGAITAVVNAVLHGAILLLAGRPWGRRHADALLFAEGLLIMLDISLVGWVTRSGHNDLLLYATIVPMAIAVTAPWRPLYSFGMAVPGMACLVVARALGTPFDVDMFVAAYGTFGVGLASAVGSQVQRRLWLELERARAQLVASERMSTLGRMAAGVAHELKTPLAAAMNGADGIRNLAAELRDSVGHPDVTTDDLREIAAEIGESVELVESCLRRSAQFVQAMRDQTVHMNARVCEPYCVADAIARALTLLSHRARHAGVLLDTDGVDATIVARGDAGKLAQIVTNLVSNAIDACGSGGTNKRVAISTRRSDDGNIVLVVEDDGPGVPAAIRDRIFDALFTTKARSNGTGLGLAISRDIAEGALSGRLELAPSARGARFELTFPSRGAPGVRAPAWAPAMDAYAAR